MSTMLRRLRGALGVAVTWSVACAALFVGAFVITRVFDPGSIDPGEGPARVAGIGAVLGFATGAAFAALLAIADRKRNIGQLSVGRAALWGALGTAAFPVFTSMNLSLVFIICPVGAALAAASVAVAKRAALKHTLAAHVDTPSLMP